MRITISDKMVLKENFNVHKANVPLLIGLDILDKYELFVNNFKNVLRCTTRGIEVELKRKHEHVFLEWNKEDEIFYTCLGLVELRKNVFTGFQIKFSSF